MNRTSEHTLPRANATTDRAPSGVHRRVSQPEPEVFFVRAHRRGGYCVTVEGRPRPLSLHFEMWDAIVLAEAAAQVLNLSLTVITPNADSYVGPHHDQPFYLARIGDAYRPTVFTAENLVRADAVVGRHVPVATSVAQRLAERHLEVVPSDRGNSPALTGRDSFWQSLILVGEDQIRRHLRGARRLPREVTSLTQLPDVRARVSDLVRDRLGQDLDGDRRHHGGFKEDTRPSSAARAMWPLFT